MSMNSNHCHQSSSAGLVDEPSFHEKYPEGRARLLALAESTKFQSQNAINQSPINRHSASPGKPRMGLKDVRNRASALARWNHGTRPATTNCSVYLSEQSLPDKLSQAIKGGITAAFKNGGNSNSNQIENGAVTADDVVYFSSSSNSTSSQAGAGHVAYRKMKTANAKSAVSKSTERLNDETFMKHLRKIKAETKFCHFEASEMEQKKLEKAKNLTKIQDHASYGMNLEDLKKMYCSMPDCSTPIDDSGDGEMRYEHDKNQHSDSEEFENVDESEKFENEQEITATCNANENSKVHNSIVNRKAIKEEIQSRCYVDQRYRSISKYKHAIKRQSYVQDSRNNYPIMSSNEHTRDNCDDSAVSPTIERHVKITLPQITTQRNDYVISKRISAPCNMDFRASCGSPTDSGYRSVPRDEESSQAVTVCSTTAQVSVTNRVPLYTAVPKAVLSVTSAHPQSASNIRPSESATCDIVIPPNASPAIQQITSNSAADSADRRQKSKLRTGPGNVPRMGSVPSMTHQMNPVLRQSFDETAANANIGPCHSPYSDLSSPSYGTSSSGASSSALAAVISQSDSRSVQPKTESIIYVQHQQPVVSGGSFDTINTNVSLPEEFSLERCPKLIELDRVPWCEKDVVAILQKGRTRELVDQIAIDVVPRLTYLLQRPLVRIARETQRLCQRFNKCTKYEIQYAAKIILPSILSDSCQKAALQAVAMYTMSGESSKQSKSQRAGLRASLVGKFHRWMCDAQLALCIHDQSVVYLTAIMENLLEEIVLQSMPLQGDMLTSEHLETALTNNAQLWGLLQPYSHLICSRTANGTLALPHSSTSREGSIKLTSNRQTSRSQPKECKIQHEKNNDATMSKDLEQCLLATCVGSINELADLINRVLNRHSKNDSTTNLSNGNIPGSTSTNKQTTFIWGREALKTLFYFMRCSQLEHADNPQSSPAALVLAHERPYLVLPPLIEWLRVSQAHTEYRQACVVDTDDVLQAARVLLPGLDCPPRAFGIEDTLPINGRTSPQTHAQRLKHDLAYRMLTSGNADHVTQAIGLLGAQNLDIPNDQGLTPLMWACLQGDECAARALLNAGVNVNIAVTSTMTNGHQKSNSTLAELTGWTALTFAVSHRHYALAHLLLEKGAVVESVEMCTETPLQIAAMMGHHDLVNLLISKGADPFYSTIVPDAGFKQRGCASSVCLAACHGHRTVLQIMLSRRRGRNDEVLSLEDFLAEGVQSTTRTTQLSSDGKSINLNNQQSITASGSSWLAKLTKSQQKTLQDTMYQAAECGHVDITMDLRHLGVPWNTHVWTQTLASAHELRRKALVQLLLGDFVKYRLDDVNEDFIDECLPLLFDIFRQSKNEVSTGQLAEILCHLYGDEPIPDIDDMLTSVIDHNQNATAPRIDAKYVNNPDLSDVRFLIDGRTFYAHKIVLINASDRFKRLLQHASVTVQLQEIRYDVFQMMMEFLYNGRPLVDNTTDLSTLSQLLCAANEFGLKSLKLHCQALIARCLDARNCVDVYRFALHNEATELMRYCEGYFLKHLPSLINRVDGYRRLMLFNYASDTGSSSELHKLDGCSTNASNTFDISDAFLQTLTQRLRQRLRSNVSKKS